MPRTTRLLAALAAAATLTACGTGPHYTAGPLANSTPCGVLTADQASGDTGDINTYLRGANPYLAQVDAQIQANAEDIVLPPLLRECGTHPAELLSAAYDKAATAAVVAPSTADPCAGHDQDPAYAWCHPDQSVSAP